ncbi:MAG: LysR family transcriptional regulator [Pseudomonadota bacterium]
MQQLNWDNLRYVLMVAEKGSISAAARELGVNRTTVLRRIDAFQQSLQCRIFERTSSGYALTLEAEEMIRAARQVENTLYAMQRQIAGRELRLEGELRVTTTDSFMVTIIGPLLAQFQSRHPNIVIDVLITNSVLDLNRRDADVAIRPTSVPDPDLVGYRLRDIEFGVYASRSYLEKAESTDWRNQRWVGLEGFLQGTIPGQWLRNSLPVERFCMRGDSFVALKVAAENGIGVALIPCILGDSSEELERIPAPTDNLTTGLWALTHPDLVRSARVQAFIDFLRATVGSTQTQEPSSVQ